MNRLMRGAVAGAAGTMALDLTTYGDMLLRGRAASSVPADVAGVLAARVGIRPLAAGAAGAPAANRRQAAGALLGYGAGIGLGTLYGLLRGARTGAVSPLAGWWSGSARWPPAISPSP